MTQSSPAPAENTSSVYKIEALRKDYHNRSVLNIDALEIHQGEVLALVGPSGSGKSTFLRLLNFLEQPSGGIIEFEGFSFGPGSEAPLELRRRVTTVFQKPMLLDRSVWENVVFGLRLRRRKNHIEYANTVLEAVGLTNLSNQRARTLSGGEAQRVALARAMVINPDVLLLDEPTANLDPYNVSLIENIVTSLNQQHKTTLVLVTHNVFQAQRLAHRVAFLLDGKVIEVGNSHKIFNQPDDSRTKAFISGEMIY